MSIVLTSGGRRPEEEEGEAEGRREEGRLEVHADGNGEPQRIEAEVLHEHGHQDRHVDEADLVVVEKNPSRKMTPITRASTP